jgi:heme A synthase
VTAGTRHLARHQVMGLAAQFLLGMAVNLLGLPSQAKGTAHTATTVFLAAHMLITVGLLAGAIMIIRATARPQNPSRQLAICGAIAIAATTAAGILTRTTKSNWWSYTLVYGGVLMQARTPSQQSEWPQD